VDSPRETFYHTLVSADAIKVRVFAADSRRILSTEPVVFQVSDTRQLLAGLRPPMNTLMIVGPNMMGWAMHAHVFGKRRRCDSSRQNNSS